MATPKARRSATPDWPELAADVERLLAGRPPVEDVEPGAAVRDILDGRQPSVRLPQ